MMQQPVLSIIHCMLHHIDLASAAQFINADLLRVIAKYLGGSHWKEALKILKLMVTRSSTLVAPSAIHSHLESSPSPHPSFSENEIFMKKVICSLSPEPLFFYFFIFFKSLLRFVDFVNLSGTSWKNNGIHFRSFSDARYWKKIYSEKRRKIECVS